ncbi:MAG: hypothetical protein V4539_16840 [Bacteroidota bacterium]
MKDEPKMREMIMRTMSLMTFEPQLRTENIHSDFTKTHQKLLAESPDWSTSATRQRMIASYWYHFVLQHFGLLILLPVVYVFIYSLDQPLIHSLGGILIGALLAFLLLYLLHYRPYFIATYLPRLETAKESYEHRQSEQFEKCRQAQMSNLALALVIYAFDKTSRMNSLQCNDQTAALLTNLFGVDQGSLKKNLELIYGKKKDLPPRKLTEIANRVEEATTFFEAINFPGGVAVLNDWKKKYSS